MTIYVAGNEPDVFSSVSDLADVLASVGQGVNLPTIARAGTVLRRRATGTITFPGPRQAGFFHCRLRPRGTGSDQLSERLLEFRDSNGNFIFGVRQAANSGEVRVDRHDTSSTVLIATMPATPAAGDAFDLDVQWRMANNITGRVEMWIDGVSVFLWEGPNVVSGPGPSNIASIIVRAIGSDTDTGENHNTHIGQIVVGLGPTFGARVYTLPILAFGDTNEFTGTLSDITAATSNDGAAISSSAGALTTLFTQGAPGAIPAGWHIEAVFLSIRARRDADPASLTGRIKIGSTTYSMNTVTLGASFAGHQFRQIGNPSLNADQNRWTEAAVGAAQPGLLTVTNGAVVSKAVVYAVTKLTKPLWTRTGAVVRSIPDATDNGGAFNALFLPHRDRFVYGTTRVNTTLSEAWLSDTGFSEAPVGSTTLNAGWSLLALKGRHVYFPRQDRIVQLMSRPPIFVSVPQTAYSDDGGNTWTTNPLTAGTPQDLAWSPELGLAVLVCTGGNLYTSTNGITFTARTSGTGQSLWGVAWSPELALFVVVGAGGTILTSTDGTTWTPRTNPIGGTSEMRSVAWSPEQSIFVAVGGFADGRRLSSTDGITWVDRGTTNGITPQYVTWLPGLGIFLAACTGTSIFGVGHKMLESADGVTWSVFDLGAANPDFYRSANYSADRGVLLLTSSEYLNLNWTSWGRSWHMPAVPVAAPPLPDDVEVELPGPVDMDLVAYPPVIAASAVITLPAPVDWELFTYTPALAIGGAVTVVETPAIEVQTSGVLVWGAINPALDSDIWIPLVP